MHNTIHVRLMIYSHPPEILHVYLGYAHIKTKWNNLQFPFYRF